MVKHYCGILILLLFSNLSFGEDFEILVEEGNFIKDDSLHLIVCNNMIYGYDSFSISDSLRITLNEISYGFITTPEGLSYGEEYQILVGSLIYKLYFSALPLINMHTEEVIFDEPKVLAEMTLRDQWNSPAIITHCGIELRGGYSQILPKKSYDIELWDSVAYVYESGVQVKRKIPLLGMRDDDDWVLLAMFNEPMRVRNKINHKLWRDIHTPYYIEQEENAQSGIRTEYVELAINNKYLGIYALGEQVDKKQLKLEGYSTGVRGELYKGVSWGGAVTFDEVPEHGTLEYLWGGFEQKYPKPDEFIFWENLENFVSFVVNSSDEDFEENIATQFSMKNAIDYFIFMNLIVAPDNRGKNLYIAKYKEGEPYFYVPWDLDGTFGIISDGTDLDLLDEIFSNSLFDRLLNTASDHFYAHASIRWFQLRETIFEENALKSRFSDAYEFLLDNGNYAREALRWGDETLRLSNLDYTFGWIERRLASLDIYFDESASTASLENSKVLAFNVYPNPVQTNFRVAMDCDAVSYELYNINGTLFEKGILYKNDVVDISRLTSGMYVLKILKGENQEAVNLKVIKE